MCDIGRIRAVVRVPKPERAGDVLRTVPARIKELVYVRRIPRVEGRDNQRRIDS